MTEPTPDWVANTPSTSGVHPSSTDETQFTRPEFLKSLPNFISYLVENVLGLVVKALFGAFIPGDLGTAFSQLVSWVTSVLPAQILEPFQDLVDALVSLLGRIPIVGPIITQLASMFGFMHEDTTVAQNTGNNANTAIAELKAQIDAGTGGALITDTFDRAQDTSAGGLGANWSQTYDSGSGTLGTSGTGTAHWTNVGTNSRTCRCRYTAMALNTDLQKAQVVLATELLNIFVDPQISLLLRMNAAEDAYLEARVDQGHAEIGYVVAGVYTRLGAQVTVTSAAGDLWEFRAGTAADDYQFLLLQNGLTVVDRIDSGHASQKGAAYRYFGAIAKAGAQVVGFISSQKGPPDMQVVTATDYTP